MHAAGTETANVDHLRAREREISAARVLPPLDCVFSKKDHLTVALVYANNLVWIDMEMSGLNPDTDRVLEIAIIVTDTHLNVLAEAPVLVVHQDDAVLDAMDNWNKSTHGKSGLIDRVRASLLTEQQADCFAGVYGHFDQQYLEEGDVEEGLRAAAVIGDDMIQKQTQGHVVPESFTHGSSQQRTRWFRQGLDSGSMQSCDTFRARDL